MTISPILCVFLFECFGALLLNFTECPHNCKCYKAPKDGKITDVEAFSLICKGLPESQKFKFFKDHPITTLALEGIGFESKSNDYFSGISINNLVFRDSTLSGSSISSDIFSDMKVDDMKVLTFINVNLEDENPLFWTIFKPFENLRAIHIENGKLTKLDSSFGSIPAENILTAEFDNIGLEVIETNTFKNWKSLKMLTITDNLIKHFEWIPKSTELWNLDLRRNKIKTIPKNLHELLPNLRVLKLDDNNLRYIPYDAIKNLKEFSFEGSKNSITPDSNSLCANGDMTWILEYTENLNFKLPQFLLNSLFETKCKVFNGVENVYKSCHELKQTEFSCDDSGQLKVINQSIYFNGDRIFFSGADSYSNYGRDFGNGSYKESKLEIETLLASIEANGGNSVTVYIHVDGQELPHFDSLIGNYTESLIADLKEFLNVAEKHNLFVILSLWNGYLNRSKISQLITDNSFQQSYIDKIITPMATALSNHKALAIWQIIKGPEGMVAIGKKDPDPCFDTSGTKFYNTQWKDSSLTMKEVLRFINQMSSALHTVSPSKLVTVSIGNIEGMMSFNYFTKDCLKKAGGHDNGYLDIYVLGSIKINEEYSDYIPLQKTSFELKLDKPVIIADVSTNSTNSSSLADVYLKFLKFDYSGCLALGYRDLQKSVNEGLKSIDQRIKKIVFNEK